MLTELKRTFETIGLENKVLDVSVLSVVEQEFNQSKIQMLLELDAVEFELVIKELVKLSIITDGQKDNKYNLKCRELDDLIHAFCKHDNLFDSNTLYIKYVEILDLINKQEKHTEEIKENDSVNSGLKKLIGRWFN